MYERATTPIFPCEIFRLIVHETHDFATLRALSLASKALSIMTTSHMLRLAVTQDARRIRDPGFLVYGGPALFDDDSNINAAIIQDSEGAKAQSHGNQTGQVDLAPEPDCAISNHPRRCEQEIRDAAAPVVLWAALQPPRLATELLARVQHLDPKHIWSMFLVPSTACREHWPWPRHLAVGHALEAPLHVAARHGNTQVIRWLLQRQHLAVFAQSVLWPHLGQHRTSSSLGCMHPVNLPAIQPCVCPSHHLKVHFRDRPVQAPTDLPWASALHIALAHSHLDAAQLLVDTGADWATGQYGTKGISALMIATANALFPFLDYLIDASHQPCFQSPSAIHWEDGFSIHVKDYALAVGSVPERRMVTRRLAALEARFSKTQAPDDS